QCRRGEADRRPRIERRAFAFEQRMLAYVQEDVEVTRRRAARASLTLARQADARAIIHTRGHVDRQRHRLVDAPFAAAVLARIADRLPCAMTGRTRPFDHEEALLRAHLAMPATGAAGLGHGARRSASAAARLA